MKIGHRFSLISLISAILLAASLVGAVTAAAQSDPRVADIVRTGKLRVALGLGTPALALKDPATGSVRGPAVDLARALARRIGVELVPVEYQRPGAILGGLQSNAWDVTFMVVDAGRAAAVDFSPPYMQTEFTYLVPAGSSIRSVADVDRPGIRIADARGDASGLLLSRTLKQAKLVPADSLAAALDMLRTGQADARAAPRPVLLAEADQLPGSRVLEDGFAMVAYAAVVPKGRPGMLAYVGEFVEAAKASGLVQQTIDRAGLRGVKVAPAGMPAK